MQTPDTLTETESRLLAAGDALADAAMALRETCERVGRPYPKFWAAREREWRALARSAEGRAGVGRMSDRIRDMLESRDDEYVERLNEIARLTAELAEAQASEKATARVLETFCTQRDEARAELAASQERERVLREAVELAMRYLEPTTNCYQVLQSALRAALGEDGGNG